MPEVTFSRAAEADPQAIDDYTCERFGVLQAIATSAAFDSALALLTSNLLSGRLDERLSPLGRPFRFRSVLASFVIVYQPTERGVHTSRDLPGEMLIDDGGE